jgi:hypothetical protein
MGDCKIQEIPAVYGESSGTFTNWENWKRYNQDITNSIWNLSSGYGILLDMVEGSGKVPFLVIICRSSLYSWKNRSFWIRGGKVGKVYKEGLF